MIVEPTNQVIAFGPYRFDRASGRLFRGGASVPLRPKTFAVLEYLALRPGRLVTKNELLDAVWPGTHVTPSVLTGCIRELRKALGDDARTARFVETAHRRGYRFVAEAVPASANAEIGVPWIGRRSPVRRRELELAELARWFARAVARVAEGRGRKHGSESRSPQVAARTGRRARFWDPRRPGR